MCALGAWLGGGKTHRGDALHSRAVAVTQLLQALLELTVLGQIHKRVNTAVTENSHNSEVIEPVCEVERIAKVEEQVIYLVPDPAEYKAEAH